MPPDRRADRFWAALETLSDLEAPLYAWRSALGNDLALAARFLRPVQREAQTYPCPSSGGDGCPRRVVVHPDGRVRAVCGDRPVRCPPLDLNPDEIVYRRFHVGELLRALEGLGVSSVEKEVAGAVRASGLVRRGEGEGTLPFRLLVPEGKAELCAAVDAVLARVDGPCVLATPTGQRWSSELVERVRARGSFAVALSDLVVVRSDRLVTVEDLRVSKLVRRSAPRPPREYRIEEDDDRVRFTFRGTVTPWFDDLGARYVAWLLRHPGVPVEARHLAASFRPTVVEAQAESGEDAASHGTLGDAGELLDGRAASALRKRLSAIDAELADSRAAGTAREKKLRAEKAALEERLRKDIGPGGRPRKAQDPGRAEANRVSEALRRFRERKLEDHPAFQVYLRTRITRDGALCFEPEGAEVWGS
jgi:hypothetical protein